MERLLKRISRIRPSGSTSIRGRCARSSVRESAKENSTGTRVSTSKARGSSRRSSAAAWKPSTSPESPPFASLRRQCSSCTVGTGSRYGLSVCGVISAPVKARLFGSGSTRTSKSSP